MILAAIVILFFAVLFFSPLKIRAIVEYSDQGFIARVTGKILFLPFTIYKSGEKKEDVPGKKEEDEDKKKDKKSSMEDMKSSFHSFLEGFKKLQDKLVIRLFRLEITLGFKDAASTGILTGAAWAFAYNIVGLLDRNFVLKKHVVNVNPVFGRERLDFSFEGIFSSKLIYIFSVLSAFSKDEGRSQKSVNI